MNAIDKLFLEFGNVGQCIKYFGQRYVTKALITATLIVGAYGISAQNVEATYKTPMTDVPAGVTITQDENAHVQYKSINAGEENLIYEGLNRVKPINVFEAPNNHVNYYNKDSLNWEGSGDINGDGVFDNKDPQAVYSGNNNLRGNVDLQKGITSNDAKVMGDVLSGTLGYLPTDWNKLNSEEKGARFMSIFVENADISQKMNILGGDCVSVAAYFSNAGMGIENVDNLKNNTFDFNENIVELMKTKSCAYNMPVFETRTSAFQGDTPEGGELLGPHKINSTFNQGATTNMTEVVKFSNYLYIEPSIKEVVTPGHLAMRAGDVTVGLRESTDDGLQIKEIKYNIDGDSPKVTIFDPEFLLTAPSAVKTEFEGEAKKTINYNANIDLEAEGKPDIQTNADLYSHIIIGESPYNSETQNVMMVTTVKGDKRPLTSNPQLENICYEQDIKTVVSYVQKTHKLFQDHYAIIKEDSFTSTITVDDLEAPNGQLSQTSDKAEPGITPGELAKKYVTNVTDNSGLAVDTITSYSETPTWSDNLYDYYDVNVALMDKSGNEANVGNFEAGIRKFPTGVPVVNMPEFVKTFARGNEINIKYMPQHQGDINFNIVNMAGQVIDNRTVSGYPGGEGQFSVYTSSPGLNIVQTVQKTNGQKIVDVDKVVTTITSRK